MPSPIPLNEPVTRAVFPLRNGVNISNKSLQMICKYHVQFNRVKIYICQQQFIIQCQNQYTLVMQGLISNLTRPFRFRYSIFDLGPKYSDKYDREDSSVLNDRGYRIQYSYYKNKVPSETCLVYAHCNSGCRIQGLQFINPTIQHGWNLCLFDFSGSGISEGQYISLGYFQYMDLQVIISMMLKQGNNKINLWGRSMGAATIILYLSQTKQIDTIVSCVLDSPYSSLWKVIKQFGKSKTKIPEFIVEHVMQFIRKSIIKQHQFDIKQMDLLKKIHHIDLPIMFIASTNDSFVNCNHAAQLYKWAGSKQKVLEYIEKQHNSPRQFGIIHTGIAFMSRSLTQKEQNKKQMRILSKKKQLCRKMTGNNMAELITKPVKNKLKNQSVSTDSFGNFRNACKSNNNKQTKQVAKNIDQKRKSVQKSSKSTFGKSQKNINVFCPNLSKNPHTIQQSVIKLALPPKQILQQIKNSKILEQESNFHFNATINPQMNLHKDIPLSSNIMGNIDKENNLNLSNKSKQNSENEEENIDNINQKIYNFSSIMTKRYHFDRKDIQDSIKVNLFDRESSKDKKSKTQKISRLYVKESLTQYSPTRSKPSGLKLYNKKFCNRGKQLYSSKNIGNNVDKQYNISLQKQDNMLTQQNNNKSTAPNSLNELYRPKNNKNRVKTQVVSSIKQQEQNQSNLCYNYRHRSRNTIIQNKQVEERRIQPIRLLSSSYSQKSNKQKEGQTLQQQFKRKEQPSWFCGANICKQNTQADFTRQVIASKFGNQAFVVGQKTKHRQLSYHEHWNPINKKDIEPLSYQNKIELKHFQSIGDLPSSVQCNQNFQSDKKIKVPKTANESLNKTHKIIKIQLDRNLLRGQNIQLQRQNSIQNYEQIQNINLNINVNLNVNNEDNRCKQRRNLSTIDINPSSIELNPTLSKFKLKNKKLLKINPNQQNFM